MDETYHLIKDGWWPAPWIELDSDEASEPIHVALYGQGEHVVHRQRVFPWRGAYLLGGGTVRVRDPLGLFSRIHQMLPGESVLVYPHPIEVPQAVEFVRTLTGSQHRWRFGAADASVGDLRNYVPGDSPSRIHWRTSARRDTLIVTDPESVRPQAVWLLVDLGGDPDLAERTAGIAAYLAERLWSSGPMGAIVAGEELAIVPVRRGRENATQILTALATTRTAARSQADRLHRAASTCEHPGALLLVSPHPAPGFLGQRLRSLCPTVRAITAAETLAEEKAG